LAFILGILSQGSMTASHAATTWLKDRMLLRNPMYACPNSRKSGISSGLAEETTSRRPCRLHAASLPLQPRLVQQQRHVLNIARGSIQAPLDSIHSSMMVSMHCCHIVYVCVYIASAQYLDDTFGEAAQAGLDTAQLQLCQGPPEGSLRSRPMAPALTTMIMPDACSQTRTDQTGAGGSATHTGCRIEETLFKECKSHVSLACMCHTAGIVSITAGQT